MKKNILYCLMVIFCVISVGCAKIQTVVSSSDELLLPIENHQSVLKPDFQFLGKIYVPLNVDGNHMSQGARLESESLVYGQSSSENVIEKALITRTYEIRGASSEFLPDLDFHHLQSLGSGTLRIASKKLSYHLLVHHNILEENEKKLISDNKLHMGDCYLLKAYTGKLKSYFTKAKSHILYLERISNGKTGSVCNQVIRADDQRIGIFSARADKYVGKLFGVNTEEKNVPAEPSAKKPDIGIPVDKGTELEKKLTTLKSLLDKNLITQDDYNKKKSKLLEDY
ncbi:MAG: SHOCT domain-containing protein [Deltaproteobacteria bacterium]|nr:SHOCT domain-containing protein [Deltaproteobacteria bacterium]